MVRKNQLMTEQTGATKGSAPVELSEEALHNLTGYLDILIQMDLAQKRNLRSQYDEDKITGTTTDTATNVSK